VLFCALHRTFFYGTPLFYAEPKSLAYAEWSYNLLRRRNCGSIITIHVGHANYPGYSIPLLCSNPKYRPASGPGDAQPFEKARVFPSDPERVAQRDVSQAHLLLRRLLPVDADGLVKGGVKQMVLTGRNAHAIVSDQTGKYVFVPNLGSDAVLQFVLNAETGMLEPNDPPMVKTKAGQGPRHIVVSPDNTSVYAVMELTGDVVHYTLDPAKGTLTEMDTASAVPPGANLEPGVAPPPPPAFNAPPAAAAAAPAAASTPKVWAADIDITPNGKFLYATERTTSTIALFTVAPDSGALTYVTSVPTEKQPRGIRIDPTGRFLIASGEKSDKLSVYAIDQDKGALSDVGRYPVDAGANWIEIVNLP
jgi:6-phosphogluconolactonase